MAVPAKKTKAFADKFVISHLRKTTTGVIEVGGVDKDSNHHYIPWDGWNNPAKGVIAKKLAEMGISKDRYAKYGHSRAMTVEEIMDSAIGELVRIPVPDQHNRQKMWLFKNIKRNWNESTNN